MERNTIEMDTFYVNTLIFFLKAQQGIGYRGIEMALDLIDNEMISDDDKRDLLFDIFHKYGLCEVSYKRGMYQPTEEGKEEYNRAFQDYIKLPAERREIHSSAGIIKITIPLN